MIVQIDISQLYGKDLGVQLSQLLPIPHVYVCFILHYCFWFHNEVEDISL